MFNRKGNRFNLRPARKPQGFNASALQVRRAYMAHFNRPIPKDKTYVEMGNELVSALGLTEAQRFILSQSNDPSE